ncbi:MAG TPA: carboxypeptidase-like regulatory domain-containing protein [Bryobacteraceae bacterium]
MKYVTGLGFCVLICVVPQIGWAQPASPALSGTVNNPSGSPVNNATVTARNTATSESAETHSDPSGHYSFANLPPGTYEVTAVAEGFGTRQLTASISAGAAQTLDIALGSASTAPNLGDLGFPTSQTSGNAADQARLDRRTHMLQMHQRLGLITAGALAATLISSGGAGGRSTSSSTRDLHAALGSMTAGLYFWTASYAIRAPRIQGTPTRGPIRVHKALAWVHGTGMILTPALGIMAFDQKNKGERVHGLASAHGPVGWTTGIAYGLAIATVSFKF